MNCAKRSTLKQDLNRLVGSSDELRLPRNAHARRIAVSWRIVLELVAGLGVALFFAVLWMNYIVERYGKCDRVQASQKAYIADIVEQDEPNCRRLLRLPCGDNIDLDLVLIPAGSFMMGSPLTEPDREEHEGPRHRVRITQPFYMGIYEVTQAQWQAVMGTTLREILDEIEEPYNRWYEYQLDVDDCYAMYYVSWTDASEFCRKLSTRVGYEVRLPTEAEWEYACRAGTTTAFNFGDDKDRLRFMAWYLVNGGGVHPGGMMPPNAWGLFDMHGNVGEWCLDWYGPYAAGEEVDPRGPVSGERRVSRGGAHFDWSQYLRSASRCGVEPNERDDEIGFRVVVTHETHEETTGG